ncbi:hypothetical protein [Alteribacter aurantiacus]|nr:hypothetical protein [Alteribacter aurantiacus]
MLKKLVAIALVVGFLSAGTANIVSVQASFDPAPQDLPYES